MNETNLDCVLNEAGEFVDERRQSVCSLCWNDVRSVFHRQTEAYGHVQTVGRSQLKLRTGRVYLWNHSH